MNIGEQQINNLCYGKGYHCALPKNPETMISHWLLTKSDTKLMKAEATFFLTPNILINNF